MSKPKVYTSYFANIRNMPSDIEPIAISLYTPQFYQGKKALEFAPSKEILNLYKNMEIGDFEYRQMYLDLLLSRYDLFDKWISYFKENKVALVCYEGRGKFCHRHILAELLTELGFDIEEL